MEIIVYHNNPQTPYNELASLLNRAFEERKEEGINFSYATYTVEDLKKHIGEGYYLVSYEEGKVVGMVSLLQKERYGIKYSTHECLAVDPTYKNKGVASKLFLRFLELARDVNIDFIISTTAEKAYSSIRYHHKNGFKTFLFVSFPSTAYYSYCFIYPIRKFKFLKYSIFNKPIFWMSYFITKIFYKENKI